jgi:hypothetical protein
MPATSRSCRSYLAPMMRPLPHAISKPCPQIDIRKPRMTIRCEHNDPTDALTILAR